MQDLINSKIIGKKYTSTFTHLYQAYNTDIIKNPLSTKTKLSLNSSNIPDKF